MVLRIPRSGAKLRQGNCRGDSVAREMRSTAGVADVHDLHVWALTSNHPSLSAHLVLQQRADADAVRRTTEGAPHSSVLDEFEDSPARHTPPDAPGAWRILRQLLATFLQAIIPEPTLAKLRRCKARLHRHMREPPRRRLYQKMARVF